MSRIGQGAMSVAKKGIQMGLRATPQGQMLMAGKKAFDTARGMMGQGGGSGGGSGGQSGGKSGGKSGGGDKQEKKE